VTPLATHRKYCTFHVAGRFLGIEIERVQEVVRAQPFTEVPLAASAVRGLINLRGQVVPALELRHCLGMEARAADVLPMNVVVRVDDRAISLLVDEVGDVLEVPETAFEHTPHTLEPGERELFSGLYKLEDRLLLILDTDRAVAAGFSGAGADAAVKEIP